MTQKKSNNPKNIQLMEKGAVKKQPKKPRFTWRSEPRPFFIFLIEFENDFFWKIGILLINSISTKAFYMSLGNHIDYRAFFLLKKQLLVSINPTATARKTLPASVAKMTTKNKKDSPGTKRFRKNHPAKSKKQICSKKHFPSSNNNFFISYFVAMRSF